MFDDFPAETVEELQAKGILRVEDGNHGNDRPRSEEFGSGNTAFIRAADMDGGRVLFHSAEKINDVAVKRIRKGKGLPGDILFSSKGTVGKLARTGLDAPAFVCSPQTTYWRTLDEKKLDRAFLYFFMCSPWFIEQWEAIKGETDMADYASLTAQRRFKVPLPPLKFQKDIVSVLGPIDDKIEVNRQMNRTLEETAGALYRSWFVDFDPVVAKAAGRAPAHLSPTLAALFPATFQDSDLGPIPKGWRVGRLDEVLVLQRGFDLPAGSRTAGPYPIFAASGLNGTHHEFKVKGPGVTTGRSGVLGKVYYVEEDFWPLNTSLWIKEYPLGSPLHAYHLLQGMEIETYNAGSAVPTLNRNHVHNLPVVIPPPALVQAFEAQARPLFQMRHHNEQESHTLAALRDTLLPKLLSGEVRVKEAEKRMAS